MDEVPSAGPSGRDTRGRFAHGNPGGPGGSRRAHELRQAAINAITTEHIEALVRKATRMGLEGNLVAMRLVFERTSGKPVEVKAELEPIPITLPKLTSPTLCARATDQVLDAVCRGLVDKDTAHLMLEGIQTRLRAIEAEDLETRLTELEKTARMISLRKA